jgi:hypothetical protein
MSPRRSPSRARNSRSYSRRSVRDTVGSVGRTSTLRDGSLDVGLVESARAIEPRVNLRDRDRYFGLVKNISEIRVNNNAVLKDIRQFLTYIDCVEEDLVRVQQSTRRVMNDFIGDSNEPNVIKKLRAKIREKQHNIDAQLQVQNERLTILNERSQQLLNRITECNSHLLSLYPDDSNFSFHPNQAQQAISRLAPKALELHSRVRNHSQNNTILSKKLRLDSS